MLWGYCKWTERRIYIGIIYLYSNLNNQLLIFIEKFSPLPGFELEVFLLGGFLTELCLYIWKTWFWCCGKTTFWRSNFGTRTNTQNRWVNAKKESGLFMLSFLIALCLLFWSYLCHSVRIHFKFYILSVCKILFYILSVSEIVLMFIKQFFTN